MSDDAWVKIDRHWCLTEDGSRVVPDTDPEARWLHWTPGTLVSREEAERMGAVEPAPEPDEKPAPKQTAPAAKKATPAAKKPVYPPQNKRR
jgi:hypothetical protein